MIYVVEDETSIRELLLYTLENVGLSAVGLSSAEAFWKAMREERPSLVLLDIMLPGEDGLSIVRRLRASAATEKLPILILSAKDTEYDKVKGLEFGADDYLAKPFGMMELVARVKGLLRRSDEEKRKEAYALGDLSVSLPRRTVSVCGNAVTLTHKEFELLIYLMENTGIALTRDQILSAVWSIEYAGETRTVDVHIQTLRTKLGRCGELIQTVRGVGYKLEAPS